MEDPYPVENIKRLCVFMFQTWDNSQLCTDSQYSSQWLTIVSSLKKENTQPLYIFSRENTQNSEPQNGPRRGLDYIALQILSCDYYHLFSVCTWDHSSWIFNQAAWNWWRHSKHDENWPGYQVCFCFLWIVLGNCVL